MASFDSLGDRMKSYEHSFRYVLPRRMPLLIRVDGVSFHSFCRGMVRPFDHRLVDVMDDAAVALCNRISGAQLAYVQSDEISILVHNYKRFDSDAWFNNEVQKVASVAASTATSVVSRAYGKEAVFDGRVWVMPENDVVNYFLWRQQDASRNSLSMLARAHFSHKECDRKPAPALHDMLHTKGLNWNDLPTHLRRGRCVVRRSVAKEGATRSAWVVDREIPIFSQDRDYVGRHLVVDEG